MKVSRLCLGCTSYEPQTEEQTADLTESFVPHVVRGYG
jgi:hypothetical protein